MASMNPKPLPGTMWVFDVDVPGSEISYHYLLLDETNTAYATDEWAFKALTIETGKIETAYFSKKSRNHGGWKEDK